jgi:hypothetical protein
VIIRKTRGGGCTVFGFCDNSVREKEWRCSGALANKAHQGDLAGVTRACSLSARTQPLPAYIRHPSPISSGVTVRTESRACAIRKKCVVWVASPERVRSQHTITTLNHCFFIDIAVLFGMMTKFCAVRTIQTTAHLSCTLLRTAIHVLSCGFAALRCTHLVCTPRWPFHRTCAC